jgi:hypothetical protein
MVILLKFSENVEKCLDLIVKLQLLPHIMRLLTPHTFTEDVMIYTGTLKPIHINYHHSITQPAKIDY